MAEHKLVLFTDSSFGDEIEGRKSTNAYALFYRGCLVSYASKSSSVVALSTNDAETQAAVFGLRESTFISGILQELDQDPGIVEILIDNQSTLDNIHGDKTSDSNKHASIRLHWLRDMRDTGFMKGMFVNSEDQLADLGTKPLGTLKHRRFSTIAMRPDDRLVQIIKKGVVDWVSARELHRQQSQK